MDGPTGPAPSDGAAAVQSRHSPPLSQGLSKDAGRRRPQKDKPRVYHEFAYQLSDVQLGARNPITVAVSKCLNPKRSKGKGLHSSRESALSGRTMFTEDPITADPRSGHWVFEGEGVFGEL